jgi:hypothetical protein
VLQGAFQSDIPEFTGGSDCCHPRFWFVADTNMVLDSFTTILLKLCLFDLLSSIRLPETFILF